MNTPARWLLFAALTCLAGTRAAQAANCLPEGGDFEAGLNGFGVTPVVLVRNWPKYIAPTIDNTTAGQGRRSLKLVNASGQDVFEIRSRAFRLATQNQNQPISVSFYARTDTAGAEVRAAVFNGPQPIVAKAFSLENGWKRYEFTIIPTRWNGASDSGRASVAGVYFLSLDLPALHPWKTIWLDGIQVEQGLITPYAPPTPTSLAFTIDRPIAIYHPDETPQIILHAAGPGVAGQTATVQIEELVDHKQFSPQQLTLAADGDADHAQVTIPLGPRPRGCYRITARLPDGTVQYRGFGVIESLAARPHAQRAFFGGSIETIQSSLAFAKIGVPAVAGDAVICSHYSPDATFALARDLGWGWWHAYWPYSPMVLEPHENQFLWTDSDTLADLAQKHDLEIMANLCAHGSSRQLPDWMKGDQIGQGGTAMGKGDHLLDPDKYGAYAAAVAAHFKDKIKLWEPWNEPGVKMRATEYVPRLRAAYQGIKSADPTAIVYGLCGTWDVNGDLYGWVKNCLAAGAADCMDKISIHGYHVVDRRYAAKVKQIAKEMTGRDWAVADTEAGPYVTFQVYPQLTDAMFGQPLASMDDTIGSMPRLYINELANGVERASWFNLTSYYAGIHYRDLTMLEYDGSPTPALIAYNTLIDLLGPSKHYRSVPMGGDVAIEVFTDGQGQPLAALWADKKPQTLHIPLSSSQVQLVDLLGQSHPPPSASDGIELKLDQRPVFLRTASMSPQQITDALNQSEVVGLADIAITRAGLIRQPDGKPAMAVVLQGKTARPAAGELHLTNSPWPLADETIRFNAVPLDESQIAYFPLSQTPGAAGDAKLDLSIHLDNSKTQSSTWPLKIWSVPAAAKPITVDGDPADWDSSAFQPISNWVRAAATWDSHGIYFAFRCDDTTPQQHVPKATPWRSDSVELYFNPSIEHSFQDGEFSPGDSQVICAAPGLQDSSPFISTAYRGQPPGSDLNKSPRMVPDTIQSDVKRSNGGYTMEIFIPWQNFPQEFAPQTGQFMGFSMDARDVNADGAELRRAMWAGDEAAYRNTSSYGVLLLTK